MRIRVRRTGGFAGIERTAEVEVTGPEWESLASAVLAGPEPGRVVPDGFSYEITVDGRTVRCADPHLTDAQRTLVTRVLKEGA
ncbi:protealysin inhibitor emfourin [Streptomyces sp. NPDC058052]|uniref:protealysin inhibitor emfourin n=1 Tax=Streptomyces sp. NPDC058052 TaxID=3346316 RepID=UPI0036EF2018